MVALLIALALHGSPAQPHRAVYSRVARDTSYERRMLLGPDIPAEDGSGWIAPLPAPVHHKHRRHK